MMLYPGSMMKIHRIDDRCRQIDDLDAGPVKPDYDFDIEVHARTEFLPPVEVKKSLQRIDAKAAHRIFDLAQSSIDTHRWVR